MLEQILDLHIHSKYSRACSPNLELPKIAEVCIKKGINIVSTGDFTHPLWFKHMEENLEEIGESGLYKMKYQISNIKYQMIRFMVGTEISCVYKHRDKTRRLHLLVFAPSLASAKQFNSALEARGVNLHSDGRPIMGVSAKEIVKICLGIDERMMIIPAHAWTPWFAVFGSKSGYDSLEECFEELTPNIFAIETGLSSDPTMNRRLSQLDKITLVSNSDAHSLDKLGREANVLAFENENDVSYSEIRRILETGDKKKFLYTIEFYPEEGMYHFDGHRDCKVALSPQESRQEKNICPKCKKQLTIGVLNRVDSLADREEKVVPTTFIPHRYTVPLKEIIANSFDVGVQSKKVEKEYGELIKNLSSEFDILLHKDINEIVRCASDKNIAVGIANMRLGMVKIVPGFDGVYGAVDVFPSGSRNMPTQSRLLV